MTLREPSSSGIHQSGGALQNALRQRTTGWNNVAVPSITGRVEITLSVRNPQRSAAWYSELLGMRQTYEHTSDDGSMRYICLREPISEFVLCVVGHKANPGDDFNEHQTGLDHLEFVVEQREDLDTWAARLDDMGVQHSGVKEFDYTANSMLTFRDPDNIQLEFFWRAPSAATNDD
jgi:catechol 2,3-dioxygenase-like lactoylglutathione lyase family enzyme